jgi:deazaflavin-dependent oxidoreductase (nitroreductase family)
MTMPLVQSARRRLYRGQRPGSVARFLNTVQAQLAARGIGPARVVTLDVRGRKSGRMISLPVVVADYAGERYLVSMFGESSAWVRNLRAADGRAVLRQRTREAVHLEEVPVAQRPPILKRYLEVAPGARPHIHVAQTAPLPEFERIASDYPVFHIAQTTSS